MESRNATTALIMRLGAVTLGAVTLGAVTLALGGCAPASDDVGATTEPGTGTLTAWPVVDELRESVTAPDRPTAIDALPGAWCGSIALDQGEEVPSEIADCLANPPARAAASVPTVEGDPIVIYVVTDADGGATFLTDNRADRFGAGGWHTDECAAYDPSGWPFGCAELEE